LQQLSEDNIKSTALRYLKSHYRNRPRVGLPELKRDLVAEGGIIVDGLLELPQTDRPAFRATIEATSALTRDEVRYTKQWTLLYWDATAAGLVTVALGLTYLHLKNLVSFPEMGFFLATLATLAAIGLSIFLYKAAFGHLRRYRYIYAIEQFKRYYANEQWIAIGEDVFADRDDPYFKELRDQCIYNGFGVIVVDTELNAHIHITPSPVDLFEKKRKTVRFFSLAELTRRLQQTPYQSHWKKLIDQLPWNRFRKNLNNLLRFRRSYFHQVIISLFALTIIGTIFYRETLKAPIRYVNEKKYARQMAESANALEREPEYYVVDTPFLAPFRSDVSPYLDIQSERFPAAAGNKDQQPGIIVYLGSDNFFAYSCERMFNGNAPRVVIEAGRFDDLPALKSAVINFHRNGLDAMGVWAGCFSIEEKHFILVLQQFYHSREEAEKELPVVEALISRKKISAPLTVRALY